MLNSQLAFLDRAPSSNLKRPLLWQIVHSNWALGQIVHSNWTLGTFGSETNLIDTILRDPAIVREFDWKTRQIVRFECPGPTIETFRKLFTLGMQYYPKDLGFLFVKCRHCGATYNQTTAFEKAGELFGAHQVTKTVEQIILDFTRNRSDDENRNLVLAMASNEQMSLDSVFLLIRLDPGNIIPPKSPSLAIR